MTMVDPVEACTPKRDCAYCSGLGWRARASTLNSPAATAMAVSLVQVSLRGGEEQLDPLAQRQGVWPVCPQCGGSGLDVPLSALAGWLEFIYDNHAFAVEQCPYLAKALPDAEGVRTAQRIVESLQDNLGALPALLSAAEVRQVYEGFSEARYAVMRKLGSLAEEAL